MASSCLCCSRNVYIHYLFVVFVPNLMILPNIFDGRDGFARKHEIITFRHSFEPGGELTRRSVAIPDWRLGNSTGMGEMTKLTTFLALNR